MRRSHSLIASSPRSLGWFRLLTPAFHFKMLNEYTGITNEEAHKLVQKLYVELWRFRVYMCASCV